MRARARGRHRRDQALSGRRDDATATPASPTCARSRRRSTRAEREGIVLLVHGEVTDPAVDVFDREAVFIERHLVGAAARFPGPEDRARARHHEARARSTSPRPAPHTAATITAHHLLYNRNAIFTGGIRPHYYCLPVLKREEHRRALVAAATSGSDRFFLGTDSAPHPAALKEHASGCAGCYTALQRARAVRRGLRGGRRARPARAVRQPRRPGLLRPAAATRRR